MKWDDNQPDSINTWWLLFDVGFLNEKQKMFSQTQNVKNKKCLQTKKSMRQKGKVVILFWNEIVIQEKSFKFNCGIATVFVIVNLS